MAAPLRILTFPRRIDAVGSLIDWIDGFAADHDLDPALRHDTMLIAEELFTNHVRHQPTSIEPIEVMLQLEREGGLTLEMVDPRAVRFDPRGAAAPKLDVPGRDRVEGGLGLFLVRSLAVRIDYEYERGVATTRVHLARDRSGLRAREGES